MLFWPVWYSPVTAGGSSKFIATRTRAASGNAARYSRRCGSTDPRSNWWSAVVLGRRLKVGAFVAWLVTFLPMAVMAQQPPGQPREASSLSSWSFDVAPYIWLPTLHANLEYNLPPALGGRLPTDLSSGPGDYISKLNFATMFSADARYDRFSVLTDFMYTSGSVGSSSIRSIDFFGLPSIPVSRTLETSTSSRLTSTIWTLAGGYTVFQGNWGNFDVLAGFRYLGVHANTDYSLALNLVGPRGNDATFGGVGSISGSRAIWNGIVGLRGRIRLPVKGMFIPYYFDIGGGGSNPTWQIASGIGYQTGWVGVSLLYRYLSFEQSGSSVVKHLNMGGPMIIVSFTF